MIGDFYGPDTHFVERLTFGKDAMSYTARVEDPTIYTRPWTIAVPMKRVPDYEPLERHAAAFARAPTGTADFEPSHSLTVSFSPL